ncbi:mitochondrial ribosomal protein L48 isoform X2 [Calliopsis andreniformis]|uniref:mitochondrial ribosomal protein L48 isoform X2 n=1 Tax=Calliopsis andreniformis TaxID=337506 RepID=UPI003FCCA3D4
MAVIMCSRSHHALTNKTFRYYTIYMPPYLQVKKTEVPLYPTLNIQIRGYVFPLLESYQAFISKLTDVMDIDVEGGFAFPHQEFKIKKYKTRSSVVESEYNLKLYERDMQVSNISAIKCPIFIRILEATLPEGISLHINMYDPEIQKKRYIPDKELLDLKSELDNMKKK